MVQDPSLPIFRRVEMDSPLLGCLTFSRVLKEVFMFPSLKIYNVTSCIKLLLNKEYVCLFVCLGLTSLSTLSVISQRCLVVTGSSMLTFLVLPHCDIRSQTCLPDTTLSHIILTPERPVLALPRKSECQAGSNQNHC